MASLPPLTTTAAAAAATTPSFPSLRQSKLQCKALNNPNQNPTTISQTSLEPLLGNINRRNILLGMGSLYSSTTFPFTKPVSPDFYDCRPAQTDNALLNCCPPSPLGKTAKHYKIPKFKTLRTRKPAHLADSEYIHKFSKGIELMKALPEDDPRNFNFMQQANVHCAYCNFGYHQEGNGKPYRIHGTWLFFPFHRWLIYFFERILGKLIGDEGFVIPFWNWDAPAGMQIPAMFADESSPLYDRLRNLDHLPPAVVNLEWDRTESFSGKESTNAKIMRRQMVSGSKTTGLFFGERFRSGQNPPYSPGAIERAPHNTLHDWTGQLPEPYADMGAFYSAARDPIFYAHHANADRMWVLRKRILNRPDPRDPDWRNAKFYFYDENGEPIYVTVGQCVETEKLGYDYDRAEIPWISPAARAKPRNAYGKRKIPVTGVVFPKRLDRTLNAVVRRPRKSRSEEEKEREEEVLVVYGIEIAENENVKFDVYVNEDDVTADDGAAETEFAGSFTAVPHGMKRSGEKLTEIKVMRCCLNLGISEMLEDLGSDGDESLLVTLVPRTGSPIIGGVKIEFDKILT